MKTLQTILLLAVTFWAVCSGHVDDFEDTDLSMARLRVERGDYSIGGPLAKEGSKNAGSSNSGAASAPVPAPAPAPAPPPSRAPAPAPAPTPGPGPAPAPAPTPTPSPNKPQLQGQPTQIGSGNGKSGTCPTSVYPSKVLSDIFTGTAHFPDYNLKFTDTCKMISECVKMCQKSSCNYFIRSTTNGIAYFYTVKADLLAALNLADSPLYDSFVPQCAGASSDNGQFVSKS